MLSGAPPYQAIVRSGAVRDKGQIYLGSRAKLATIGSWGRGNDERSALVCRIRKTPAELGLLLVSGLSALPNRALQQS